VSAEGKLSGEAESIIGCGIKQIGANVMGFIGHNVLEHYGLTRQFFSRLNPGVGKKAMTVTEMASMGGRARAARYTRDQLREFARDAGRPAKLDRKGLSQLRRLLAAGRSQAECARVLGVSVRTIGRAVARIPDDGVRS